MDAKGKTECCSDESGSAVDFELILEWARLAAWRVRRHAARFEEHSKNLTTRKETGQKLQEFHRWRESSAFSEREKAAINLSESLSLNQPEALSQAALKDAKRHFNRTEMISLTLSIQAINDLINAQANSPVHVLVVEDDPQDRELLRWQLKKAKMEENVIFVPDARQALTVLSAYRSGEREGRLIALFLDLVLPGMNGVELLRQIRATPETEHLPVIVMTSSRNPLDMEECHRLKVVSYVEKPITFGSFSKAIANIFHEARAA